MLELIRILGLFTKSNFDLPLVHNRYQAILDADIPKVELLNATEDSDCSIAPLENGYTRIISGESLYLKNVL